MGSELIANSEFKITDKREDMLIPNSRNDALGPKVMLVKLPVLIRKKFYLSFVLLTELYAAALTGCSFTKPAVYHNEELISANTYAHSFAGTGQATCEAARRALLGQGYIVSEAKTSLIKGSKNFQRGSDTHVQIEFNVVCAPNSEGSNTTTAFANAVRDIYSLKKSSNSASVGIGVLGSLSVPYGSTDESLVKVGSETIASKKFYDRFFELVDSYLDVPSASQKSAKTKDETQAAPARIDMDPDS